MAKNQMLPMKQQKQTLKDEMFEAIELEAFNKMTEHIWKTAHKTCFNKCITKPRKISDKLDKSTQTCITNCAQAWLEALTLTQSVLAKMREEKEKEDGQ